MPNPQNIKPPKKGEVRNPKGKPKGTLNRATILQKWLSVSTKIKRPDNNAIERVELIDAITLGIIKKAISGDVAAYREIMDTLHGKISDKIEHSGELTTQLPPIILQAPNAEQDETENM